MRLKPLAGRNLKQQLLLVYTLIVAAATALTVVVAPTHCPAALAIALVSLLSGWCLAHIAWHRVRRQVHHLRELADSASQQNLSKQISEIPTDDFAKLSESLNQVAAQLRATLEEQERLQHQLTRSEKMALIGELAATVAHEVNNPLDGLQNSVRILQTCPENQAQVKQLLDLMADGLYRIEMIVKRLLTMSRDEPISTGPTRIRDVVDDALLFVKPRMDRRSITIEREFPESPIFIQADRSQLAQALINLLINAADAMPTGGRVTIRSSSQDDTQLARLEIADTGPGIDEEALPHIFDAFYTTKSRGAGTGLGLAVTAQIVEAHGGRIEVETNAGEGTCFRLMLPLVASAFTQGKDYQPRSSGISEIRQLSKDRTSPSDPSAGT